MNAFTFTGEQTDATTAFEYRRAYYYDPATGMFLSLDPTGSYDYAYDNPAATAAPLTSAASRNFPLAKT